MGSLTSIKQTLGGFNAGSYISLLSKLMDVSSYLQNNPPANLIPEEDRVVEILHEYLRPLGTENGGPLVIEPIGYTPRRGNLIVEYPGTVPGKVVSFVGMHMDVVPAIASDWEFYPFKLGIDGDELRGRGTTDCLGHVALVTELMRQLGETKPKLKSSVVAVFIANEEYDSVPGVGVDALMENGWLDSLKYGPLYWVDSADKQPTIGSGGMIPWTLEAHGKLFHSGLPQKAINAMELAMEALKVIQTRFYEDFPRHPKEDIYKFQVPSTMKPTQWSYPGNGISQIPGECTIAGDVRLTPFYDVEDVKKKLQEYVDDINNNIEKLDTRGPVSKYVLPDENLKGSLKITFGEVMKGIAVDLESRGYEVLSKATKEVLGTVEPFSITGSLPIVKDLQDSGYDVQITGYGIMDSYHANNEKCLLSDMKDGYEIFVSIISQLEED